MNELFFLTQAAGMTVGLAISALLLGFILAMLFVGLESARSKLLAWPSALLVMLLRGLPEILVVLGVYYGSSQLILTLTEGFSLFNLHIQLPLDNINISPFLCGVVALALLYSAYASQTLRGALRAIPYGQREAGLALGMDPRSLFFRLILPQMWRHALPGLGNQWLVLLKDTALVSLISVNDLMLQTKSIASRTQQPFTWYLTAAAIYLLITMVSQAILRLLAQKASRFEQEQH